MLSMTGDLDRQLKISAHITQSALRPQPLDGGCKTARPPRADWAFGRGGMEKGAGSEKNKQTNNNKATSGPAADVSG